MPIAEVAYPESIDTPVSLLEAGEDSTSVLTADITDSTFYLPVQSTDSFPDTGVVRVDDEFIFYTSKDSTNLLGLTRGVNGSVAASHTSTVRVLGVYSALHHNTLVQAIIRLQTKLGIGSSVPSPGMILAADEDGNTVYRLINIDEDFPEIGTSLQTLTEAIQLRALIDHTHTLLQVEGLSEALTGKAPFSHSHIIDDVEGLEEALDAKWGDDKVLTIDDVENLSNILSQKAFTASVVLLTQKGVANGVATLGSDAKVPSSQLPSSILGAVAYQGVWDANTNTPTLSDTPAPSGHYRKVSVAGATTLSGVSDWKVGDWLVSNGTTWDKIDNTETVSSVAGRIGAIILTAADLGGTVTQEEFETLAGIDTSTPLVDQLAAIQTAAAGNVSDVADDLADEVTRATDAETALGVRIDDAEQAITDEATARDAAISTAISGEVTARDSAIGSSASTLNTAITAEATARGSADTTLQTNITAEATARASAVSSEASARASADSALDSRIDTLESDLPGEVSRAQDAESTLASSISTLATTAQNADIALDGRIDTLEAGLPAEVTRATTAEGALDGRLDTLETTTIPALDGRIDDEVTDRSTADTNLQTNITSEATTRGSADTTLQTNITAEATARASADTTLQTNITSEASARAAADTTITSSVTALDAAAEKTANKNTANGYAGLGANGRLQDSQQRAVKVNTASADFTYDLTYDLYLVDATSGNVTVTIPTAAGAVRPICVKKVDSSANTVTLDPNSSETIDGAAALVLAAQYASSRPLVPSGGNWHQM